MRHPILLRQMGALAPAPPVHKVRFQLPFSKSDRGIMTQKTPLYQAHIGLDAKMVDFGGWDMPLHYGSQLNEHHSVRQDAGIFDVSHMTIVDVKGEEASHYLRYLLANDIAKLDQPGKALYSCMLNDQGGIIDDLIVYFLRPDFYRVVVNAATRDKDLAWMKDQAAPFSVTVERQDLAMIAAQGPLAFNKLSKVLGFSGCIPVIEALKPFEAGVLTIVRQDLTSYIPGDLANFNNSTALFIARTGYTGEDGFEIILPAQDAASFWQQLIDAGFSPCGLGARDTLRLEAALNLYGSDMDDTTTPYEANLAWTVALNGDRDFIGRKALEMQKQNGVSRVLVGLELKERGGILRGHQKVFIKEQGEGEITSGTFSPSLNQSIALARIPVTDEVTCRVEIRGKLYPVQIVKPPFVKRGQRKTSL